MQRRGRAKKGACSWPDGAWSLARQGAGNERDNNGEADVAKRHLRAQVDRSQRQHEEAGEPEPEAVDQQNVSEHCRAEYKYVDEDAHVLTRRAHAPWQGLWCAPSGFCDGPEHPILAAEREVLEGEEVYKMVSEFTGVPVEKLKGPGRPTPSAEAI